MSHNERMIIMNLDKLLAWLI